MPESVAQTAPVQRRSLSRSFARVAGLFRGGWRELAYPTERRVPFLDGLRAFAVLMVVFAHSGSEFVRQRGANSFSSSWIERQGGWLGVDLFFVLSGYFIGSQLWRELSNTGTISIRWFMVRRGLRIWPLYFFVFLAVTLLLPGDAAAKQHGWTDLVFITNYTNHGIVAGSWSLCSEEQFYLLAPLALALIGRRSMRSYRWGLAVTLVVVLVVRALTFVALTGHFFGKNPAAFAKLYYPFHTHCDGLIAGLLLANLVASKKVVSGLLARPALLILATAVFCAVTTVIQGDIFPFTSLALFFSAIVWWGVQTKTRLFGQHIFYLLSRLSFGMYLNHEYMEHWVIQRVLPAVGGLRLPPGGASFFAGLILTVFSILLSTATFCLVEHPFLMLRTALLRWKADAHLVAH